MTRSPSPRRAGSPAVSAPAKGSRLVPDLAQPSPWTSIAVGAVALLPYLAWAPRASGGGDSSEFTAVLATLGLAHPTCYPLYTVLGHGFVVAVHTLGARWEWAANAWSGLGGAVAVGLWHALGARLLTRAGVAPKSAAAVALLPAAAFGLDPAWTQETSVAEVTSWHLAWAAGALLVATGTLVALPSRRGDRAWMAGRVALWSAIVGLGVVHHASSLLLAIPLTVTLLVAARPFEGRWVAPALAGVPIVALGWSYVLFRSFHPAAVQWGSLGPGLHETWIHVTGAGYRHFLGSFAPSEEQKALLASSVYPWLAPGLAALLFWAFVKTPAPRALRVGLAAAALAQTAYTFAYGVGDPSPYFLPAVALGLFALPASAASIAPVRRLARPLCVAAACGLAIGAWFWAGAAWRQRARDERLETFLRSMWKAIPVQRGFVVWDADMMYRLVQYQQVDHEKTGLTIVGPRLLVDLDARRLFARRHGFDPLRGADLPPGEDLDSREWGDRFAARIVDGINRSTPDTVVLFLPQEPSLRLLDKPSTR